MIEQGNIDVNHRPTINNPDGSHSTIFSMTVPIDKNGNPTEDQNAVAYALVPSIADGKFLLKGSLKGDKFYSPDGKDITDKLEDAAADHYANTRQHLGIFARSGKDGYGGRFADDYAERTHAYMPNGGNEKVFIPSYAGQSNMPLTRKEYEQALANKNRNPGAK